MWSRLPARRSEATGRRTGRLAKTARSYRRRFRCDRETLGLLDQLGNGLDTGDRRFDLADALIDIALQTVKVIGSIGQASGGEKRRRHHPGRTKP